ncbi:MAG: cation acetate symporter [Planctomycetota bacterium]
MSGEINIIAITIFSAFVVFVIGLSFHLGRRAKSAAGYFAAGGQIHWGVNGVSFAGDYLSAASFLGICGLIATVGYDGFLYSIGYLAGWIVALFVVAEPMKRLGKYTFTDALDSTFNHRGIKLAAAISTLVVSIFYLIPQMVGAGVLVTPLLGLPHWVGVTMVGAIVITIVATAGMASTTYVQFLKGGLLIVFSTILVGAVLMRGLSTDVSQGGIDGQHAFVPAKVRATIDNDGVYALESEDLTERGFDPELHKPGNSVVGENSGILFLPTGEGENLTWWKVEQEGESDNRALLKQCQWVSGELVNGREGDVYDMHLAGRLTAIAGMSVKEESAGTGPIGPVGYLAKLGHKDTVFEQWKNDQLDANGREYTVAYPKLTPGNDIMKPGVKFKLKDPIDKWTFISLMLALFCGTAALPHILIRYYTVPSPAAARKSTIVAIASIGFFYVLTLFMGLGGAINGVLIPAPGKGNMAAPLLANSFGSVLFAIISAIAFATVLGTVSGLIVASSGAVAHDLLDRYAQMEMTEKQKVVAGKVAAIVVGVIAIILGIVFENFNVSFLVGWAFAVAASANLPAILMLLFWKKTTAQGIVASIVIGIVAALGIILTGPEVFVKLYGMAREDSLHGLGQPGIISIPLSFIVLVVVSLMTQKPKAQIAVPTQT